MTIHSATGSTLAAATSLLGLLLLAAAPSQAAKVNDPLQCKANTPAAALSCCQAAIMKNKPQWMSSANLTCHDVVSCGGSVTLKDRCIVTIPDNQTPSHGARPPQKTLSDLRLKTDIHRVGTTVLGLPLYSFQYKNEPGTYIGVMAQDVLKVEPAAVSVGSDGYYRVNYQMLGIQMLKVE